MINLQNVTHLKGDPQHFVFLYNSQHVVLSPRGGAHLHMKRMRIPEGQPKYDVKGMPEKDPHGNAYLIDRVVMVLAERVRGARKRPPQLFWQNCPEDLYAAVRGGTWAEVYTTGKRVDPQHLEKQPWYEGGSAWEMTKTTPSVPHDLARIEDLVALLEKRSPPEDAQPSEEGGEGESTIGTGAGAGEPRFS